MSKENLSMAKRLMQAAMEASEYAYTPYSRSGMGAAVMSEEGAIYKGVAMEIKGNDGICAGNAAFSAALAGGVRRFKALAIWQQGKTALPCEACRKAVEELAPDIDIITGTSPEDMVITKLAETPQEEVMKCCQDL